MFKFSKDEDGTATVEFVIIFTVFFGFLFSIIDAGWHMVRIVQLERATDLVSRDLRLGFYEDTSYDNILKEICDKTGVVSKCQELVVLQSETIDMNTNINSTPPVCFDPFASEEELEEFDPSEGFAIGARSDLVIIRACAKVRPILATASILSLFIEFDDRGYVNIETKTGILNEP